MHTAKILPDNHLPLDRLFRTIRRSIGIDVALPAIVVAIMVIGAAQRIGLLLTLDRGGEEFGFDSDGFRRDEV